MTPRCLSITAILYESADGSPDGEPRWCLDVRRESDDDVSFDGVEVLPDYWDDSDIDHREEMLYHAASLLREQFHVSVPRHGWVWDGFIPRRGWQWDGQTYTLALPLPQVES